MSETIAEARSSSLWPLHFLVLAAAVVLLCATRVPFDNEYIYLLRLATVYDPTFLANDFSFGTPATEHGIFNYVFGLLTFVFSIEVIAWIGRIACWVLTLIGLMRLGRHWNIPAWMITVSILIWLCQGQAVTGGEWMIGSFEAKTVAYACLVFALDGLLRRKAVYPAILLGLTFSFHPAVGMWAILAAGLAMLYARWKFQRIAVVAGVTLVFSLPGLIAVLSAPAAMATAEDWKFVEVVRLPGLLDPFAWPKAAIVLVILQLAFCLVALRSDDEEKRFLSGFVAALGLFFTLGIILRATAQWELLRLMPTRLFPVFVALFFLYTLAAAYRRGLLGPPFRWLAGLALACLLLTPSPLATANSIARLTYETWAAPVDDETVCFEWIRDNTPKDAVFITSSWRKDFWYRAERAQVFSGGFPAWVNLKEWRQRDQSLNGESLERGPGSDRVAFYNSLPKATVDELAARFGADHMVTEAVYPYPLIFQSGSSKVYRLR